MQFRDVPDRVVDVRLVDVHRDDVDLGQTFRTLVEEGGQPVRIVRVRERGREEGRVGMRRADERGEVLRCGDGVCQRCGAAVGVIWFVEEFEVGGGVVRGEEGLGGGGVARVHDDGDAGFFEGGVAAGGGVGGGVEEGVLGEGSEGECYCFCR